MTPEIARERAERLVNYDGQHWKREWAERVAKELLDAFAEGQAAGCECGEQIRELTDAYEDQVRHTDLVRAEYQRMLVGSSAIARAIISDLVGALHSAQHAEHLAARHEGKSAACRLGMCRHYLHAMNRAADFVTAATAPPAPPTTEPQ